MPFQHRDPLPQVYVDQVLPDHRVLEHALGIGVDRGVEGLGGRALSLKASGEHASSPRQNLCFTSLGIQSVAIRSLNRRKGLRHGDEGAIDGGEQGMQVPGP